MSWGNSYPVRITRTVHKMGSGLDFLWIFPVGQLFSCGKLSILFVSSFDHILLWQRLSKSQFAKPRNFQFKHCCDWSFCQHYWQCIRIPYTSLVLTILTQIAIAAITSSGFEHFINGCGTVDGVPDSSLCSRQASSNRLSLWLNHCFGKILQKPGSSTLIPL